jgi:hypothetical protein
MWTCSKCRENLEDDFDVCWSCGTSREGVANTEFNPETDGVLDEKAYQARLAAAQNETFVTVATFGNAPEAHMARSRLESEGISAFLMDELAPTTWGLMNAPGGVRLQVAEKDAVRARVFLADLPRLRDSVEEEADESADQEDYEDDGENEDEDQHEDDEDDEGESEERIMN